MINIRDIFGRRKRKEDEKGSVKLKSKSLEKRFHGTIKSLLCKKGNVLFDFEYFFLVINMQKIYKKPGKFHFKLL